MSEINWEEVRSVADRASNIVAREWRIVEADDLKQECMAWAYENKDDLPKNPAILYGVFRKVATRVASKERDYQDMFYSKYWYTPEEIRQVLRSLRDEVDLGAVSMDNLDSCSIDDSKVIARVDVVKAFRKLPRRYKDLLFRKFVLDEKLSEADRKASYDAVDRLTQIVNRNTAKETADMDPSRK
ncbi:hypothetical protein ADL27_32360 [Streptomyces sp. NRRL F-6602]|nr:hypothetical protein ADL27_32360 [Streptomyces sp. NRRL F-6602]